MFGLQGGRALSASERVVQIGKGGQAEAAVDASKEFGPLQRTGVGTSEMGFQIGQVVQAVAVVVVGPEVGL